MTIALKNLMNDIYAKDISQKVYSALDTKKRSGEFIGNFAAYGYVKSPEDRHKLAVDPDAAKVVRRIFRMKKDGMSIWNRFSLSWTCDLSPSMIPTTARITSTVLRA